jgi:hypothetical protein
MALADDVLAVLGRDEDGISSQGAPRNQAHGVAEQIVLRPKDFQKG